MNYSLKRGFTRLFFILLSIWSTHLGAMSPNQLPMNYYQALGIKDQRAFYSAVDRQVAQEYNQLPADQKTLDELENLRSKITKQEIADYCQKSREKAKKDLDDAHKKAEGAETYNRKALVEEVKKLQGVFNLVETACQRLGDPKSRKEYDQFLAKLQQMPKDEAYFNMVQSQVSDAIPDKKVILNKILGDLLAEVEIPGPAVKIFNQDIELHSLNFLPMPTGPDVKYGLGFSGLMKLNQFEVRLSVYLIKDIYGDFKFSYIVELPAQYKVTNLFPSLKMFDSFKFPQAKFIIANFDGSDKDGYYFKKGFNFAAIWDIFSGPFAILNELKSKAKMLDSLVFENKPVVLSGVIPFDPLKSQFNATIPLRIGLDLRKISAIPKTISDLLNRITTNDILFDVMPVSPLAVKGGATGETAPRELPLYVGQKKEDSDEYIATKTASINLGFQIAGEWGLRLELSTQPDPLKLNARVVLIPVSIKHPQGMITASVLLKNMLELQWLSIGNAALSFDFDGALIAAAAAVGLPFTGIGIRGEIDLGLPGETRAKFKTAGGFRVSATETPLDVVLNLSAENIRLVNIVNYASELAHKAKLISQPVPLERIPVMTLHKAWGYCAFKDTTIAGASYKAGIGLQLETEFFQHKAGFKIHMDNNYKLAGWGYMPAIDWQIKGQRVVKLTGLTADKGPRLAFNFDPADPYKGSYSIESKLVIPALSLDNKVLFDWSGTVLNAEVESTKFGFTTMFGIRMNAQEGMEPATYERLRRQIENALAKTDAQSVNALSMKKLIDEADALANKSKFKEALTVLRTAQQRLNLAADGDHAPEGVARGYKALAEFNTQLIKAEALYQTIKQLADMLKGKASESNLGKGRWERMYEQENQRLRAQRTTIDAISIDALQQKAENLVRNDLKTLHAGEVNQDLINKYIPLKFPEASKDLLNKISSIMSALNDIQKEFEKLMPIDRKKEFEAAFKARLVAQSKQERRFPLEVKFKNLLDKWGAAQYAQYPAIVDPKGMVQKIAVNFGFKGDFGKYLNENAVQVLAHVRDNALKKLDGLNKAVAQFAMSSQAATQSEIKRVQEAIAVLSSDIEKMEKECAVKPYYRQVGCRSNIAGAKAQLLVKKGYLNMLLQPGKYVVKGVTRAAADITKSITQSRGVRMATEKILAAATAGMDMIAKGVTMINITQARGQYDWADMTSGKLPKLVILVARLELPEDIATPMDIVLQDIQFDFKNPKSSITQIVQKILSAFIEGQQNKYLRYAIDLTD